MESLVSTINTHYRKRDIEHPLSPVEIDHISNLLSIAYDLKLFSEDAYANTQQRLEDSDDQWDDYDPFEDDYDE